MSDERIAEHLQMMVDDPMPRDEGEYGVGYVAGYTTALAMVLEKLEHKRLAAKALAVAKRRFAAAAVP